MKAARVLSGTALSVALVGCVSSPIPTDDPMPMANVWLEINFQLSGSEANGDKWSRCMSIAREHHIRFTRSSPLRVTLDLESERNELEIFEGEQKLLAKTMPGWSMEALCTTALASAVPPAQRPLIGPLPPPPGCVPMGIVQGTHTSSWGPANYEAGHAALTLRAASQGITHVMLEAMQQPAITVVTLAGQGFRCAGGALAAPGCNPLCSPGYACSAGACVPVCNPPCSAGQTCAADRSCR